MPKSVCMRVGLALALAGLAAPARPQSAVATSTAKSYARARQVLDRALQAAGGTALLGVKDVSRKGSGLIYNQGQSLKPERPYSSRPVAAVSVADLAQNRSFSETETVVAGGISTKTRAIVKGDSGFGHNLLTGVLTPATPGAVAAARTGLRRDPVAILATASRRADTLRYLGEDTFEGHKHDVLTFADADGTQVSLYVDSQTGLLSKFETLADNPVLGDTVTETMFSDYRPVAGVQVPFRVITLVGGDVAQDMKYTDIKINSGVESALFEPPGAAAKVEPAGGPGTVVATKVSDDVYFLAGSTHNSLLVGFPDHLLLVEAPLSEDRTQALLAKIKEIAPGKPVRYVVMTHHHSDHTGGLRGLIAQGATVVTTPGNKAFVDELAAATHTLRPDALAQKPRKPVVETFTGKRVFTAGGRTVEVYDIGPNPHVQEMVIAYLPQEKLVFESDVFNIAEGPLPPASPATRAFADKLEALGLQVEKIVPGHGRLGTMEDLSKVLTASR